MLFLYRFGLLAYTFIVRFAALFNDKARKWSQGRKNIFNKIAKEVDPNHAYTWFHFSSLGEFEQGRTLLERHKEEWPDKRIIITFFSPSGYEVRKNYPLAEHVFYLPIDSPQHARRFIDLIKPEQVFFIKYDYWYYYFRELKRRNIPIYLVSAIFRPNQIFFKSYAGIFKEVLGYVRYFFVQNELSIDLLKSIGIENASITGDTRFDRVMQLVKEAKDLPLIVDFIDDRDVLIAGSTWPPDLELLQAFHEAHKRWKVIIAPHDVTPQSIKEALGKFPHALLYSQLRPGEAIPITEGKKSHILIIDNVGMLSSLYRYSDVSYIGGGFGKGIHNVLEAAAYGKAVLFGPRYEKFQEANDLVKAVAAFPVQDAKDFIWTMERLMDDDLRINVEGTAKEYVEIHAGATEKIIAFLKHKATIELTG